MNLRLSLVLMLTTSLALAQELEHIQDEPAEHRAAPPEEEKVFIGVLRGSEHEIAGKLYAGDEIHLLLEGFEYDGEGKDTFFWVGTSGESPSTTGTILPYPFGGIYYNSEDTSAPFLYGKFNGSVEIRLTLPEELKVTDLKWFSVWSRADKKSFGEVIFPTDFSLAKKSPIQSSVNSGSVNFNAPPPTTTFRSEEHDSDDSNSDLPHPLAPNNNPHDPKRHDQWGDSEAKPEAEAEPESNDVHDHDHSQPRRSGASSLWSSISLLTISAYIAKYL